MSETANMNERLGIVGSGAIACGLAATAAHHGPVLLLARSEASAERARQTVERTLARIGAEVDPQHAQVVTDRHALADSTFVVEAVVEDHAVKAGVLAQLHDLLAPEAILASTTSSLSIERLAGESGRADRFVGLHVFNPVTRMQLVELAFPAAVGTAGGTAGEAGGTAGEAGGTAGEVSTAGTVGAAAADTRARTLALCEAWGKTPVEVPDVPGFVVNRLLFPYLFSAVRLLEQTGLEAEAIDTCMRLGAGHPMGPLALLDLVGLDVSAAIGETIGEPVPERVNRLIADGALGRKSGRGFHSYSK